SDRVLVCNAGHGLLLWEAYRKTAEGLVVAQVRSKDQLDHINHYAESLPELEKPQVHLAELKQLLASLDEDLFFEVIIGRNVFSRAREEKPLCKALVARLAKQGSLHVCESVPSKGSRLSDFLPEDLQSMFIQAETLLYGQSSNALTNWDEQYLQSMFEEEGLAVQVTSLDLAEERMMGQGDIRRYLTLSYLPSFEKLALTVDGQALEMRLNELLADRALHWRHHLAFVHASFQPMHPSSDAVVDSGDFAGVVAKVHGGI
ncbi:MAG: hypothetical protein VB088_10875, partial [Sphaerochaeta sp.]|nr:hypothetical protein [Sphaerochaeta sp.]